MLSGAEYCLATAFGDTFQLSKCSMDVNLANSWKLREADFQKFMICLATWCLFTIDFQNKMFLLHCFEKTMFSSHGFTGDISRQQKRALRGPRKT